GRCAIAAHMLCERDHEAAVAWVGLQLGFAQRRLTVAGLHCDAHLESTAGDSRRVQLSGFARRCICLIEFSADEKNAGQIILRRIGKWVQLYCLSGLLLRLIELT